SSRRPHTRSKRDWSSDVCSSDLDRVHHVLAHLCRSHRSGHPVAHIETAAAADMRPRPGARTGNGATEAPPSKITRVWACGANHHSVTWLSFAPARGGSLPGLTASTPT